VLQSCFSNTRLREPIHPFPGHDVIAAADRCLSRMYTLPYIGTISCQEEIDWMRSFAEAENTARMWFYSLPFVFDLIEAFGLTDDARYGLEAFRILVSFFEWSESASGEQLAYADEHAVTNRTCVLVAFAHRMCGARDLFTIENENQITDWMHRHGEYLFRDDHYVANNHRLMVDRALLQLAVQMHGVNPSQSEICRTKALKQISSSLDLAFDDQGMNTENSPSYHFLNCSIYEKCIDLIINCGFDSGLVLELARKIQLARSVGRLLVDEKGQVPLIGDSDFRPQVTDGPVRANKAFKGAGLLVIRSPTIDL
jgi:hypothetical protein